MLCLVAHKMLWINIVVVVLQWRFYQISLGGSVQDLQGSVLKIPSGIRGKNSGIQVTFLSEIVTVRTKLNTKLAILQSVNDIWNKSHMNCGNEMKMKKWSLQWMQFMQLRKEAWKKNSGLQWGLNPWPRNYQCDVLPTELWSHWLWEQVNNYCGLKSWIFFRLLKLRSLWQSFLHFH